VHRLGRHRISSLRGSGTLNVVSVPFPVDIAVVLGLGMIVGGFIAVIASPYFVLLDFALMMLIIWPLAIRWGRRYIQPAVREARAENRSRPAFKYVYPWTQDADRLR
jgi:hypothetical protein